MLKTNVIFEYPVLNESAHRIAEVVCDRVRTAGDPYSIVFLNPHSVVVAESDSDFKTALLSASARFCDGVGLSIASLVLKRKRVVRVYGFEFFITLSKLLSDAKMGRVFFLGGTEESIATMTEKYRMEFPGIIDIASYSPPFRPEFSDKEIADMADRIKESRSNVLWIGLGSPKQEKVLKRILQYSPVPCAAAVGAVFDFYSGQVTQAPYWIRRIGLQWLHRLLLEPRRLWRRTLVSTPLFILQTIKQFIR